MRLLFIVDDRLGGVYLGGEGICRQAHPCPHSHRPSTYPNSTSTLQTITRYANTNRAGRKIYVEKEDFRAKKMARKAGGLIVFIVDASGAFLWGD